MLTGLNKDFDEENIHLDLCQRIQTFSEIISSASILDYQQQQYPLEVGINKVLTLLKTCRKNNSMIYVIGNGGSAAIAEHAVIDLLNMAKLRAMTLHEAATLTCISNDYGYEEVYRHQLKQLVCPDDVLIAISSSGVSKNILNAVQIARSMGAKIITFSGFKAENPLRKTGDINLWLHANDYGFVEIGHAFILHNITDRLKFEEGK